MTEVVKMDAHLEIEVVTIYLEHLVNVIPYLWVEVQEEELEEELDEELEKELEEKLEETLEETLEEELEEEPAQLDLEVLMEEIILLILQKEDLQVVLILLKRVISNLLK